MKKYTVLVFVGILFLVGIFFSLWPLFHSGFFVSDDGEWMVIRLSAFYQSFREGQFPVRFLGRLNQSYGYPVSNFLYPGFLYFGTLLHGIGMSFINSVKFIFGFSVLGSSYFLYTILRKRFSLLSASVGTFVFLVSPYLLYDIYTRGSVGEVLSFFPFFVSLWAIEYSLLWALPLGIAVLIVSHNSLAVLFFLVLVGFIVYKKKFYLLPHVFLGLGLSAFFWMPAFFERQFVQVDAIVVSDVSRYFVKFSESYLYGTGIIGLLIFACKRVTQSVFDLKFFIFVFLVGIVFSLAPSLLIWNALGLGFFFQFPFRFLSLVVISSPFIVSWIIDQSSKKIIVSVCFMVLALFSALPVISGIRFVDRPEGYYTTNEATTTVKNEFMPRWVQKNSVSRPSKRLEMYEGKGNIEIKSESTQRVVAEIEAKEPLVVQLNSVYYPGWGASLNGQSVAIVPSESLGLSHIQIPQGKYTLVTEFRETPFRFAADSISFIFLVIYGFMRRPKKKAYDTV